MRLPLLSGVYAGGQGEFLLSYPRNLEPVPIDNGLSKGQLRRAAGARLLGTGPGGDRGGINWNGQCFRVMGSKLVRLDPDGTLTTLGDVGDGARAKFDYSFDYLAINSGDRLYLYDGALAQVTDVDLGPVVDMIWIDGYFMTTDGASIVVTELNDPFSVNPLKYGSSEDDPDPVTGLLKLRGEVYFLNRYTIEVARNVGGNGFPFAILTGAGMPRGCVSPRAKALFGNSFAFVGGGRNEAIGVYVAGPGTSTKISTRRIDDALAAVADPSLIEIEVRTYRDEQRLFVHLPEQSWVFLPTATQITGKPVWYEAGSGIDGAYRPRNAVLVGGDWIVGDPASGEIGVLDEGISVHFGEDAEWRFDTMLLYNDAKGGLLRSVELTGLPGRAPLGSEPRAFLSLTRDGETWGPERAISTGVAGRRAMRMQWRPRTRFQTIMGLRFRGYDDGMAGFAAIEADVAALTV